MTLAVAVLLPKIASDISQANLRSTLTHLGTYPTRNINTDYCTKAAEWIAEQYRQIPGMEVELFHYQVKKGRRVVEDRDVVEVVATLRGSTEQRVMMGGHFDTINLQGDPKTAIAPGINDDGSGVAATLECARVMAQAKWKNTLVFVAFSGEEQGLLGSAALAARAKSEKWQIDALLNNDIVGGSQSGTLKDKKRVRLYSEESDTHNSRELARWIEWNARGKVKGFAPWLVLRKDRFQRGGDHTSFNLAGFTGVRFTETIEALDHQHNETDTIEGIDFGYLANVCRVNLVALQGLANAGPAPTAVAYDPKQAHSTIVRWKGTPGTRYIVYWRASSSTLWEGSSEVGEANEATIKNINKDDHIFAVGSVGGVPISAN
jgi:hypothetical protein